VWAVLSALASGQLSGLVVVAWSWPIPAGQAGTKWWCPPCLTRPGPVPPGLP